MNIREQLINQFKDRVTECKPFLEKKGWHVDCNDVYIGITGHMRKTKFQEMPPPRKEQIVSLNIFNQILDDESVLIKPTFEVKTYWTTIRTIYAEIDVAFEFFIQESKQFNPKTILWSQLDNEMLQIERGAEEWKLIRKKKEVTQN